MKTTRQIFIAADCQSATVFQNEDGINRSRAVAVADLPVELQTAWPAMVAALQGWAPSPQIVDFPIIIDWLPNAHVSGSTPVEVPETTDAGGTIIAAHEGTEPTFDDDFLVTFGSHLPDGGICEGVSQHPDDAGRAFLQALWAFLNS